MLLGKGVGESEVAYLIFFNFVFDVQEKCKAATYMFFSAYKLLWEMEVRCNYAAYSSI